MSGTSNVVTVTTLPGGGGGGCSASFAAQSQWNTGYTGNVSVINTGSGVINSWTVTFFLPAGHIIVNAWNVTLIVSGQTVTARSMPYNGTLGPNATTMWGFQAGKPKGSTALPGAMGCLA
jgi:cellulase/cellobiase CelA1